MKKVAEAAGVSLMTVSRVLNDRASVKSETKTRVQQIIQEMGYQPNRNAQMLAAGPNRRVSVICHQASSCDQANAIKGALAAGQEFGIEIHLGDIHDFLPWKHPEEFANAVKNTGVGYALLIPPLSWHRGLMELLEDKGVKTLSVPANKSAGNEVVGYSEHLAVFTLTQHLISLGHRRIGILLGPSGCENLKEHIKGFGQAIEPAVDVEPRHFFLEDYNYNSGYAAAAEIVHARVLTAIVTTNDEVAAGLISGLQGFGLRIPNEISVVGMGDYQISRCISPSLTTLRRPIRELSYLAIRSICANSDSVDYYKNLIPSVIIRNSARSHEEPKGHSFYNFC